MTAPNDQTSNDARTTYAADGSEHPTPGRPATPDGPPDAGAVEPAAAPPPLAGPPGPGEYAAKPSWSTQSLADLNAAVRREASPPARARRAAGRTARDQARAIRVHELRLEAALRAERDRYGNAWEHA
jgi:hypothetical protein